MKKKFLKKYFLIMSLILYVFILIVVRDNKTAEISKLTIPKMQSMEINDQNYININIAETQINPGEEINIELSLLLEEKELSKINAFCASINYDNSVWEPIDESDFIIKENWERLRYNGNNNFFILINKKGIKENKTNVLEIKLKAKENSYF